VTSDDDRRPGAADARPGDDVAQRCTEVDGTPVFWLDGPADGPRTLELLARVGRADERLPSTGLTHLAEHLALASLDLPDVSVNGHVDHLTTSLHATGEPAALVAFAQHVCERLAELPPERVDTERAILAAERRHRGHGAVEHLLALRYGPHGPGLLGWGEVGLDGLDHAAARAWAATRFARGNVAVRCTGPIPDGLRLPLRPGRHHPPPPLPTEVVPPRTFVTDSSVIAASGIARWAPGLSAALSLLTDGLHERLRTRRGWAYATWAAVDRIDPGHAHVTLLTDADVERAVPVVQVLLDLLDELVDAPSGAAVAAAIDGSRFDHTDEQAALVDLLEVSEAALLGVHAAGPVRDRPPVTPADVHERLVELRGSLLVLAPDVEPEELTALSPYDPPRSPAMAGDRWRYVRTVDAHLALLVGDVGVAVTEHGSVTLAVRFDEVAGLFAWADGRRQLVGPDGRSIIVEPEDLVLGFAAVDRIDRAVAPQLVIPVEAPGRRPLGDPPLVRRTPALPADRATARTTKERREHLAAGEDQALPSRSRSNRSSTRRRARR
jgi:zinc protease